MFVKKLSFRTTLTFVGILALVLSPICVQQAQAAEEPSFRIAGTVFFDENGNGLHDAEEKTWIRSTGTTCENTIRVPGLKVLISYPGFNKQYPLSVCKYKGSEGMFYVTDPIRRGTTITASVVTPRFWKTTWPDPVTQVVESENYLNFGVTKDKAMSVALTTLFPNGGEKLVRGKRYKLRWQAAGTARVNVLLYRGNECAQGDSGKQVCGTLVPLSKKPPTALALNVPNRGWLYWTVPADLAEGNDYRIAIQNPKSLPLIDQSNRGFSVVAPRSSN